MVWGRPLASDPHLSLITDCITYLFYPSAMRTEGLFRIPAARLDVETLRNDWEFGAPLDRAACPDPHVVAGLLMSYLMALPEPLIPTDNYQLILTTEELSDNNHERYATLKKLIFNMSQLNITALAQLLSYLSSLASYAQENQMNIKNIAICFGPVLLRCKEADESPQQAARDTPIIIRIVTDLLAQYAYFFENGSISDSIPMYPDTPSRLPTNLDFMSPRTILESSLLDESTGDLPNPPSPSGDLPQFDASPSSLCGETHTPPPSPRSTDPTPPPTPPTVPLLPLPASQPPVSGSALVGKILTSTPSKFFHLQGIVLTALKTVMRYMLCLSSEINDPASSQFDAHHIEPTSLLVSTILQLLTSSSSTDITQLFTTPIPPSGSLAEHAALAPVLSLTKSVITQLSNSQDHIQDEALLLEPDTAASGLIQTAHVLKQVGKLLENYQTHVRRITDLAEMAEAFSRLQNALVGALTIIRNNQIPKLKRILAESQTLEAAVIITTVIRGLESSLLSQDPALWTQFTTTCQQVPSTRMGPEPQIDKLRTLLEAGLIGFDRIYASLDQIDRQLQSATHRAQLTSVAHQLRTISLALDHFLNGIVQQAQTVDSPIMSPDSPNSQLRLSTSSGSDSSDQSLATRIQYALDLTQELQSKLNNLRLELENVSPPTLITISRVASGLSKLALLQTPEEREELFNSLSATNVPIALPSDVNPSILNSLKEKSVSMLDEIRAHFFKQRRSIPKAKSSEELDFICHPVLFSLNIISLYYPQPSKQP